MNSRPLALDVLLARFGQHELIDTGDLESDLLELQRADVTMMSSPLMQKNLAGLHEDTRTYPESRDLYYERIIRPRRDNLRVVLELASQRGELPDVGVDSEYICDLLFGALLARVILPTGLPIDDRLARQTVATVLHELRRTDSSGT
ncbi:TetR-like C-terminal domain-containing protein [Microbacterium lacticum]